MFIENYQLPENDLVTLRLGNSANIMVESQSPTTSSQPASLVVWQDAVKAPEIDEGMKNQNWANRVLSSLPMANGWKWEARRSGSKETITDWSKILDFSAAASGVTGRPDGNLIVTLNLRTYEEKTSFIGSHLWWKEQVEQSAIADVFVRTFLNKLTGMLFQAHDVGADFCVEQIALIITKDKNNKAATLTPTLHSDMYYGFRETALCSILEPGYNPYGGTIFLPTANMKTLEKHRPINMEKLISLFPDIPVIKSKSGDIVLYDGMIGADGVANTKNGVPHMSTDTPGASSRLVTLIRNRRVAMSAAQLGS